MFSSHQAWMTYENLIDEKTPRLIRDLLKQLKEEGHDIEGAAMEYQALKTLLGSYHGTLGRIKKSSAGALEDGLSVVWKH